MISKTFNLKQIEEETIFLALKTFEFNRKRTALALGLSYRALTDKISQLRNLGYPIARLRPERKVRKKK